MNEISLKSFILIENPIMKEMAREYSSFCLSIIPSLFIGAIICEYFVQMDLEALIKRMIVSIILLTISISLYETSVMASIEAADEILQKNIKDLEIFNNAIFINSNDEFMEIIKKVFFQTGNVLFSTILTVISLVCFFIVKVTYSIGFYLSWIFIGVPAVINLFPGMNGPLKGGIITFIWSLVLPHVFSVLVILLSREIHNANISGDILGKDIAGSALVLSFSFLIALSPLLTLFLISGSGIAGAAASVSRMATNRVMDGAIRYVNSRAGGITMSAANGATHKVRESAKASFEKLKPRSKVDPHLGPYGGN